MYQIHCKRTDQRQTNSFRIILRKAALFTANALTGACASLCQNTQTTFGGACPYTRSIARSATRCRDLCESCRGGHRDVAARWPFHFGNARQTSGWQVDDAARPLKVIKTCSKSQCRRAPRATMRHGARWGVPKIHRAPVLGSLSDFPPWTATLPYSSAPRVRTHNDARRTDRRGNHFGLRGFR